MAIPSYRSYSWAAGVGAIDPGLPPSVQDDDILLLIIEGEGEDGDADGAPGAEWTLIGTVANDTGSSAWDTRCTVYWHRYDSGTPPGTNVPDAGDHTLAVIMAFSGCITSGSPINASQSSSSDANDSSVSITGTNTDADDCLVVAISTAGDNSTYDAWANANLADPATTENIDELTFEGSDGSIHVATGGLASQGATGTTTATCSTNEREANWTVALEGVATAADRNIDEYEEVTVEENISLVFGTVILDDPYEEVTVLEGVTLELITNIDKFDAVTVEEDITTEVSAKPDIEVDKFDTIGTEEDVIVEVTTLPDLEIDEFDLISIEENIVAQLAHEFVLSLSDNFIDGAVTTVQLLPPATKDTGDFQAGKIHESSNPADAIDLDADLYTEIEFCFKATIDAGEVSYDFRIEGLDTYTVTPQLTVIAAGETLSVNVHDCAETEVCLV